MSRAPGLNADKPVRPRKSAKFALGDGASDGETDTNNLTQHSRTPSGILSHMDSPPISPRNLTFNIPPASNPFSLNNASFHTPGQTPTTSPGLSEGSAAGGFPFPEIGAATALHSGNTSVTTSVADLTRHSSFYHSSNGSRPATVSGAGRPASARSREAFASPRARPLTVYSSAQLSLAKVERVRPKSTMLTPATTLQKDWMTTRDPYSRLAYFITYAVMLVGIGTGAIRCYFGWKDVPHLTGNLCPVMDQNFDSDVGIFGDNGLFFREVDMSGFGNGEFEVTTDSSNNSYVKDGFLYITPTLTSDAIGEEAITQNGFVYNVTGCTFNITQGYTYTAAHPSIYSGSSNGSAIGADQPFDLAAYTTACSAVSNTTTGQIINPVQSARLSTRKTASIKFGKVEVRAKIPHGDWLWPAIWMLPVDSTYGPWPISGEIDIMEARGNGVTYPKQGSNFVRGSLNWGPLTWLNAVSKTFGWWPLRRGSFADNFHTYMLEWDEQFMRISVDSRLHHMLDLKIKENFFKLGDFPGVVQNGSEAVILENPWVNGTKAAPFDQSFYLILNVAVGGTNGWFPDGKEKPWLDQSNTAMGDFWASRRQWLPTWSSNLEDRSLVIDYIKMWEQC